MKKVFLFFLFLIVVAVLGAESSTWQKISPDSGGYMRLVPNRKNPAISYAYDEVLGAYLSTDFGKSWKPTNLPVRVSHIVIHPATGTVFALTTSPDESNSFLWRSVDGRHFKQISVQPFMSELVADPNEPISCTESGVELLIKAPTKGRTGQHCPNSRTNRQKQDALAYMAM